MQDWSNTQPTLISPDIDWAEFEADYADRKFADARIQRFYPLLRILGDYKMVHDYDNYHGFANRF